MSKCCLPQSVDSPSRNPYSSVQRRGNRPVGHWAGDAEIVALRGSTTLKESRIDGVNSESGYRGQHGAVIEDAPRTNSGLGVVRMNRTQVRVPFSEITRRRPTIAAALSSLLLTAGILAGAAEPAHAADHHHHKASSMRSHKDAPPLGVKPIYESIVVDANNGRVLHQVNADTRSYPASLTKMMTLYMLFDALAKGKVHLDTPIKVSAHAAAQDPSKLDLAPGSTIAVEQAIYAVVTKSANDVAVAIAEHLGGSEEHFCALMTARAHAIGMTRTQFRDASGLPNKGQLSTARDMAILGMRLMTEFPQYFPYFSRTEFPYGGAMIHTHNHLLESYDGADGIKTGYTAASGFNLVASARRGDARLITVVFGGPSAKIRDQHVAALMDAGFNVLTNNPTAVANAQSIDPFPATIPDAAPSDAVQTASTEDGPAPTPAGATTMSAATDTVAPAPVPPVTVASLQPEPSAGDMDDTIAQKLATTDVPAPPLAATATLVPEPGTRTVRDKHAAKHTAKYVPSPEPEPATANATWGIQVGAFANRTVAEEKAAEAKEKVQATFAAAAPRIVQVRAKHGVLYRAQVVGLNRKEVMKACHLAAKIAHGGCKSVAPDPTRVAMR
ncbi:MAG: D-alanyl-D-alanine carboxypeptidase [Rhodospirillaceae bacterium]|nr:MAG: D-alanyl-D-alanine carboxypeptidase [Rhodospirillaceae bacterium]